MKEKKNSNPPQILKTILFGLLVLLPFALYMSMGLPVLRTVLYGLLLATFGSILAIS